MRLWLKDSERLPDPAVISSDERRPFIVGLIVTAAAAVVLLISGVGEPWWFWATIAGLVIGGLGLVNVIRARMTRKRGR